MQERMRCERRRDFLWFFSIVLPLVNKKDERIKKIKEGSLELDFSSFLWFFFWCLILFAKSDEIFHHPFFVRQAVRDVWSWCDRNDIWFVCLKGKSVHASKIVCCFFLFCHTKIDMISYHLMIWNCHVFSSFLLVVFCYA